MEEVVIINPEHTGWFRLHSSKVLYLVVALIFVGVVGYLFTEGKLFPKQESSLVIAGGITRLSPLYVVTKKASTPVSVAVEGVEKKALDKIVLKDGTMLYSLIESEEPLSSNIYKVDGQGVVTQLTHTATAKFNASLDPTETHVAYEEVAIKNEQQHTAPLIGDVMQLDLKTGTAEVIAPGVQPHYLHTGAILLGQMEGILVYPPHKSNVVNKTSLLSKSVYSLYAVNADGTLIASYNMKTAMIDVFTITPTGTLSFVYSSKTEHPPLNLSFVGADPTSIESRPSPKGMIYNIISYGVRKSQWTITSNQSVVAQRLLYVTK